MSNYLGDYKASSSVNFNFTTHAASGAAVAPSSAFEAADLIIYKGSSATQRTSASGITMTSPFDSIVGLHHVTIDLSDNTDAGFWAAGSDYFVVLSPDETVDSLAVVKEVASFSIENRVVNWAQVVSPTTTVGLSGTTVKTATDVETDTADIQTRIPAALSSGNMKCDVLAISTDSTAADNAEAFFDGTGYAGTGNVIPTVTNTTQLNGAATVVLTDGTLTTAKFATGAINNTVMSIDGSELTAIPWNAAWDAEVQSEAEDALVAHRLDELLNADSDIDGAAPPTVGSVFHELMSKTAGSFTFDQTTDSCEAIRDRGDAAWVTATGFSTLVAADIRTAVGLASANLDTQLLAIVTDTNEVQTDLANGGRLDLLIDAILADTDSLDTTKITTARAATLTDLIDGGRLDVIFDAINLVTTRIATAYELDGSVYRWTTNALEQAPSGSTSISLMPVSGAATIGNVLEGGKIIGQYGAPLTGLTITCTTTIDGVTSARPLTAYSGDLALVVYDNDDDALVRDRVVEGADITVSSNVATISSTATHVLNTVVDSNLRWELREMGAAPSIVFAHGPYICQRSPLSTAD